MTIIVAFCCSYPHLYKYDRSIVLDAYIQNEYDIYFTDKVYRYIYTIYRIYLVYVYLSPKCLLL